MRVSRRTLFSSVVRLLVTLFMFLVACVVMDSQMVSQNVKPTDSDLPGAQADALATPENPEPIVDVMKFRALHRGMSYAETVAVIGYEGIQIPAAETNIYYWQNPNGSCLTAVFLKGKLLDKSASGIDERGQIMTSGVPYPYPLPWEKENKSDRK